MTSKWFVKNYDRMMEPVERNRFGRIRAGLLNNAKGNVLEIGCGTGFNFQYYRDVSVTAIEPNNYFRKIASERASQASIPIDVLPGDAEELDFSDNAFDTIVGTLVFCSIPNPQKAIREIMRVCKPNGRILLFEHVRHDNRVIAALQDLATPAWKRVCDGCHLNRNTLALLKKEGIKIKRVKTHSSKIMITIDANNLDS
ncbi:class I SAM-dependent methyltransferase [Alkalihalobacillus sp. AL-G]|uniref:class I SAM-dependent methyltransferase n=1 Tax=Alkalihalobacillus sp. AL-G TaxID=2926399 RepID=UPI00272AE65D|nr:class I SAM-dependent methyltransferase [Alkalihalobacillus sp. AL-G]WLD94600.1 class I SAM-dependent methyltransferase [Alkalihalobacillus sp. AL-G]